ncbi:MAG: AAA family ATPase [Bacteroidales bacterium]|nr:AAA family ATPase [Bacteroidales bacterium]
MSKIIGRQNEITELEKLYYSDRTELVVVYGRRRVGKTFLIKQIFKDKVKFQHTGVSPIDQEDEKNRLKTQLDSFYYSLLGHGLEGYKQPKTWMEAFYQLEQLLLKLDNGERMVIFIDELPWMDTPRSGFLSAFESFWNGWCNGRDNIMLIVCGSATSWITGKFFKNKGGLYGRVTSEIKLSPFTLKETEEYFDNEGIELSRYDIVQSYMIFGGIPYYLSYFQKGLSLERNVDRILFGNRPKLKDEFNRLFKAIFTNAADCKKIIRLLATKHSGFSREEISTATRIALGGGLSDTLSALAESDFIIRYIPHGASKNNELYKLADNFCLFWLKYVEPSQENTDFMTDNIASDVLKHWKGVAFEEVCWQHIPQIKRSLEIGGVKSRTFVWGLQGNDQAEGSQIDLIIERNDNIVNLCEMKFVGEEYCITKDEELKLRHRIETLKETLKKRQVIHLTMVTTFGVAHGKHSGIVQKSLTIDNLFN